MASRKRQRRAEVEAYLQRRAAAGIGDAEFADLLLLLRPISEHDLRKLLRDSEFPISPFCEGVRQDNLDQLERTLTALAGEYDASDAARTKTIRREVITAKDHARFAGRRAKDDARRAEKEEMVRWLLVWLENPPVFPAWVKLRRRTLEAGATHGSG